MDKAILYNVKLEKLNKRIDELKSIGFNMDEFEKIKEEIINKNKIDVKNSYNFSSPNLALNQSAFLEQGYLNSINELEKLYDKLLDYEIYVMAYHIAKLVKEFLESDNKNIESFTEYRKNIEYVLKYLHNSKTLDYDVEKTVIEEIYNVVYLFIKEEMKYLCHSILLDKFGEIDKFYIDKLVRKDIEQIDLKDEKNKSVSLKVKEIGSKGFDASYADNELILAIVNSNNDIIDERKTILNEINTKMNNFLDSINKKKRTLSLIKNNLKLFLNSAVAISLAIGAYKIDKLASTEKITAYMTTRTTYNPLNKEAYTITEEYEPIGYNDLHAIDYGPITMEGKRTVTEYNLINYQNLSFEELYNMDLSSLTLPEDSYILESEDDTLKDLSNKAFRIINKITVNLEDMKEITEIKKEALYPLMVLFEMIAFMIYGLYSLIVYNNSIFNKDYLPILSDIKNISDDLSKLIKTIKISEEKEYQEYQEKLKDITNRLNTLITENKDLFVIINSYIPNLEGNEEYNRELNNLKQKFTSMNDKQKLMCKRVHIS